MKLTSRRISSIWIKSFFKRPVFNSPVEKFFGYSNFLCPLRSGQGDTIVCNTPIVSKIIGLFFGCCPSYISRPIITIWINTINRVIHRWCKSDIFKKGQKGFSPFYMNFNPSTAIESIVLNIGIGASIKHRSPCFIFFSVAHAMFRSLNTGYYFLKATTAFCTAFTQRLALDILNSSTLAFAFPINRFPSPVWQFRDSYNSPSPDFVPGEINMSFFHINNLIRILHKCKW